MKAKWLIEMGLFTDTEDKLISTLANLGLEYKTLQHIPFYDNLVEHCEKLFRKEDCVIFHGSLNFGRKLKRTSWIPGVYLDEKKYDCTSYYHVFGDELLHKNYLMMPYGDLLRRKDELFNQFGGLLFIRPSSGLKEFTGMVLEYHSFEDGIKLAGFYDVDPNLLVIVSNAKDLQKEWRFVVVNQEIVSGSLYRDWTIGADKIPGTSTKDYVLLNSKSVTEICEDTAVFEYARKIAKMYNPEPAWTLDICQHKLGEAAGERLEYKVIEIGCFSCAGMYGNDLEKVVTAVSYTAENEWLEYQERYPR